MSKDKPKILFILHYPPPVHGAAIVGQYIKESEYLEGFIEGRYINLSTSDSIENIGKGGFKKLMSILNVYWKSFYQLLTFRPKYCYITLTASGVGFYKDSLIALMAKVLGVKTIYHFHNKGVKSCQHKGFDNLLYRLVFNKSKVILLSELLYDDVIKYVKKDQLHVCHNGIPDYNLSASPKSIADSPKVKILFISNLIRSKGIIDLLQALSMLKEASYELTIVGAEADISSQELTRNIEDFGIQDKVKYLGKRYGEEKFELLSQADLFVFPTYYHNECFPLSILEAMCFGLPVISTFEGAVPDLVLDGKNGFIVSQRDIPQLAAAIKQLISDKELRQEMGNFSRNYFLENFTLSVFEKNIKEILTT
ncbi:glycosyltransferase family 4 protein [Mongoliibacter ruber]|uniref:Glycosyltransferase involved in cell wall biosynthesis n=1 Tax=Mongoliibacter ruber TaxID=1750599 RepID=A0A2T0WNW2_9BACT|nr:glycosyltransferase family 4 protein [Mongoliibacter ruber]PRY88386.1 glycosyltransferase involved in cell wall biosynthesis [Mongoliibacter ruber]